MEMKEEIWRESYWSDFHISSYGRFGVLCDDGEISFIDPMLKGQIGSKPYVFEEHCRKSMIEYLVVNAFISPECEITLGVNITKTVKDKVYVIQHKDGNVLNNHLDNLYWKYIGLKGSKEAADFLVEETMTKSGNLHKNMIMCLETGIGYSTYKEAAEATGQDEDTIRKICSADYKKKTKKNTTMEYNECLEDDKHFDGKYHWKLLYKTKVRGIIR